MRSWSHMPIHNADLTDTHQEALLACKQHSSGVQCRSPCMCSYSKRCRQRWRCQAAAVPIAMYTLFVHRNVLAASMHIAKRKSRHVQPCLLGDIVLPPFASMAGTLSMMYKPKCQSHPLFFCNTLLRIPSDPVTLVLLRLSTLCRLQEANLSDVLMDRAVMNEANLKNAILERTVFTRSDLGGAIIEGADFTNALLDKTQQMVGDRCKHTMHVTCQGMAVFQQHQVATE